MDISEVNDNLEKMVLPGDLKKAPEPLAAARPKDRL
jgi:hypothetical protein